MYLSVLFVLIYGKNYLKEVFEREVKHRVKKIEDKQKLSLMINTLK